MELLQELATKDFELQTDSTYNIDMQMIRALVRFNLTDWVITKAEIEQRIDMTKLKNLDFYSQLPMVKDQVDENAF